MSLSRLVSAGEAVSRGHLVATEAGFGPQKDRDGRFDGILSGRENGPQTAAVRGLQSQSAGPAPGDPKIAGDGRQHTPGAHDLFAIGAALHAVALVEHGRCEGGVFAGDAGDGRGRDGGDGFGPLGGFGETVAEAEQVVAVTLGGFSARGHVVRRPSPGSNSLMKSVSSSLRSA